MNFLNYFHYPFIILAVFVGLASSWSDVRKNKIKNRLLVFGAFTALFFYLAEILILLSFDISPRWIYFRDILINSILALVAGFILWQFNVWAAGDAKLFALFAFLIPLTYYSRNYLPYFPSFALLLNIFTVILAFIFLKIIFDFLVSAILFFFNKRFFANPRPLEKSGKENGPSAGEFRWSALKKIIKEFLLMPVFSLGVFIGLEIVFKTLQTWGKFGALFFLDKPLFLFLSLFIFFQIFNKIRWFFKVGVGFLFVFYLAAALHFWPQTVLVSFRQACRFQTIYFIFGFLILNKLIDFYIEKKDIRKIPLNKLKPGTILTARSWEKLRQLAPALEINPDGLTEEELGIIKDLGEKNSELLFVEIYKAIPLAPFIFLGVILTLILKGALVPLII